MKGAIVNNKYKIIKILGQDSLTETFLAQGKGLYCFNRYVIKKFQPILGNPQAREMKRLLCREASMLKLLSGKNRQIPQLYDYFMDGLDFYLVREWIEGVTLEQKVQQQGKLSETEVRQILASLLSVLRYIHNYDLVYRELSPSSIVLRDRPKGMATLYKGLDRVKQKECLPVPIYFSGVKELARETQKLSQHSLVLANQQEYVSPESEKGESAYASDLYSLGLTAIYLLTGKTPAELGTNPHTNRLLWHLEVRSLTTNLVGAIDMAISPNKSDRFTSAEQMLKALFPQSITISESLITQPEAKSKSWLTPEIKVISSLSCLGLGIIGAAFTMMDFNFDKLMVANNTDSTPAQKLPTDDGVKTEVSNDFKGSSVQAQAMLNIPVFRVGTPQERVIGSLGEPTHQSRGYWHNSKAFLYQDFVPRQVDLGYLSDIESQTILQTEASFAESVPEVEIEQVLQQLLMANYSAEIEQKIGRVVSRKSNKQEFTVDNLKGVIQRNSQNNIYVAVWENGFHQ